MAYLNLVEYDEGGRVQSLDGMAAVTYDDGRQRNLQGAELGAVKYDDGGRFRTLVGLGQDPSLDIPTDLPLTPPSTDIPLVYAPPTPSPIVDTVSAPITGTLVDYTPKPTPGAPQIVNLVSPPSAAPGVLTSIFSGIRNIFSSTQSTVRPLTPGTAVPCATGFCSPPISSSWVSGVPNWELLAGVGLVGLVIAVSMRSGGGGSRRNPRRRNPMELILMGANPSQRRRRA